MNPGNTRKNVAQFETTAGQFHFVQTDEILYLRVDKHKIDLITRKKTYPVKSRNLKDLLEEFGVPELCRCHRSFALNVRNVCSIVQETRRLWIANFDENGDICCEISKPFIAEIMKKKER